MKKLLLLNVLLLVCIAAWSQSKMSVSTLRFLSSQDQAANPETRSILSKAFSTRNVNNIEFVDGYIYLNEDTDPYMLESYGVKVNTVLPELITASIPVNRLQDISALDEVKFVQLATKVHRRMDAARAASNVTQVQAGTGLSSPFLGKDVVVGIVDGGFEYGHINFYNADRTELRVKRVWDQNAYGTRPSGYSYGAEYKTQSSILNAQYDGDGETHATHVTGIAAGVDKYNGNIYYGIAGEADIVMVSTNFYDSGILDGIKYVYDYAESVGKPCVVNLSLGGHDGPHDGTSTFDIAADALQGKGRLLVGAAGNEGSDALHISKAFTSSSNTLKSFVGFYDSNTKYGLVDIWGEANETYTVQVGVYKLSDLSTTFTSTTLNASSTNQKTYSLTTNSNKAKGTIKIITSKNVTNNKANASIEVNLTSMTSGYAVGITITGTSGTVHAWADDNYSYLTSNNKSGWTNGNSAYSVGEIGGTGKKIISVGAYVSKREFTTTDGYSYDTQQIVKGIAEFSSVGPTADGRIKPDITAPGTFIASSISSGDQELNEEYIVKTTKWNNKTYYYGMMQGTSMACPYVTGVLATWLQANKDLTPDAVKNIFKETSITDSSTGILPVGGTNTWGVGKIDAWNGIKKSIELANATGINSATTSGIHVYSANGKNCFNILFTGEDDNVHISIHSTNGQEVYNNHLSGVSAAQEEMLDLNSLNKGVYIISVIGNEMQHTSKIAIQ